LKQKEKLPQASASGRQAVAPAGERGRQPFVRTERTASPASRDRREGEGAEKCLPNQLVLNLPNDYAQTDCSLLLQLAQFLNGQL